MYEMLTKNTNTFINVAYGILTHTQTLIHKGIQTYMSFIHMYMNLCTYMFSTHIHMYVSYIIRVYEIL